MTARKIVYVFIFLLIFSINIHAEEFFDPGPGTPALGMGSAFTAMADDATAAYWNPARLALLSQQFHFTGGLQFLSATNDGFPFVAAAYRFDIFSFGAWWAQQTKNQANQTHSAIGIAAGLNTGLVQMGVGVKQLGLRENGVVAAGVGVDVAAMANFLDAVSVGIMVQDVLQTKLSANQNVIATVVPTMHISGAIRLGSFTFSIESVLQESDIEALRFGIEIKLMGLLAFRVGKDDERWSWGVGIGQLDRFRIDIAHRVDENADDVWLFSTNLAF